MSIDALRGRYCLNPDGADTMNKIENEEAPMRTMLDAVLDMGEERAMKRLVRQLLEARFGELPAEAIARLGKADAGTVERWGIRILTAASVAEVLAD